MSSIFDKGLFDNQGGTGFGSGVNGHYVQPPSRVFDKSHELASHVLAIRLYCSELEASFDLLRGKFLYVFILTANSSSFCSPYFCGSILLFASSLSFIIPC